MQQLSLFDKEPEEPLASKLRPKSLDDYVGQSHLLGEGKVLRRLIERDQITSMIFWGPPGVGKTTLANIIANHTNAAFLNYSAVVSGIKEIKTVMERAEENRQFGSRTIVFVDEIHRFNKAQQDAFLPFVERGTIILIGATTENPSFEINGALLSRCRVFVLKELDSADIVKVLTKALKDPKGFGNQDIEISDDITQAIAVFANGDARAALSTLEMVILNSEIDENGKITVTKDSFEQCTGRKALLYDKKGEEHYNLISALHKSMRNSDPDAALYWLARMLEAGEDPLYIARRIVRFAAEDVGLSDPDALPLAVSAFQACHFIGMPECSVHLSEAAVYMSLAPKSNAMETGYMTAREDALKSLAEPVPLIIRNAPTKLMKELDYGKGYMYAHDYEEKLTAMQCLPDTLKDREYYVPTSEGREAEFKKRLGEIRKWKREHYGS